MSNGENAKQAGMDRAGELPMERRVAERRAEPPAMVTIMADAIVALKHEIWCAEVNADGKAEEHAEEIAALKEQVSTLQAHVVTLEQAVSEKHACWQRALASQPAAPVQPTPALNVEKMLETNQLDELGQEVARLQNALCFWLPKVPEAEGPMRDRIANDAYLLVGYDDMPDKQSAEELGWITPNATPPVQQPGDARGVPDALPAPTQVAGEPNESFYRRVVFNNGWNACRAQALATTRPSAALTEQQIAAAGRALADRSAEACNVDKEDNWKIYSNDFIEDARIALAASGGALAVPGGWREILNVELAAQEKHYGEVAACAAAGSRLHAGEADCTEGVIMGIQYCIEAMERAFPAAPAIPGGDK